ncbi:MAG: DUF1588 domain-containing protein [Myxococcales bacterium]|nr:DUF1588 domain-containing protein [Myxococcales bacterium]
MHRVLHARRQPGRAHPQGLDDDGRRRLPHPARLCRRAHEPPTCAGCHSIVNPPGFALEGYVSRPSPFKVATY